jgi:hypothetical protein
MSVSETIDQFISQNGGNTRDALNVALTRLEAALNKVLILEERLQQEQSMSSIYETKGRLEANFKILDILIKQEENLPDSQ